MNDKDNIKVVIRVRPLSDREAGVWHSELHLPAPRRAQHAARELPCPEISSFKVEGTYLGG